MHALPAQCMQRIRAAKAETGFGKNARGYWKKCILFRENQVFIIIFVENYKTLQVSPECRTIVRQRKIQNTCPYSFLINSQYGIPIVNVLGFLGRFRLHIIKSAIYDITYRIEKAFWRSELRN